MKSETTVNNSQKPWVGRCEVEFLVNKQNKTRHQGGCNAPLKLMRTNISEDGRCELPILHTAGGLVGGDQLKIEINLKKESKSIMSTVAAQKIYGSIRRSLINPEGKWCRQKIIITQEEATDLEWLPQETIMYENALYEQDVSVQLEPNSSFLSMDIVRLGRTAANEGLNEGIWRSSLNIKRRGLGNGLTGLMRCGKLRQGIVARYIGQSSRDARHWFTRIWKRTRNYREMIEPEIPRYWPLQEEI